MGSFIIEGGTRISGELKVNGNKNAALPMIAACLLTDEEVVLRNVPDIIDVNVMLEAASNLGVDVSFRNNELRVRAAEIKSTDISRELSSKIRSSILFCGPLLARCGKASIWPPGGDVIGHRRLDAHFYGLQKLGADIDADNLPFRFRAPTRFVGDDLFFDEASVTATEHIMMAAVLAKGKTTIRNVAAEPHVTDLAKLLIKMGAKIKGLDTNTLVITGVDRLNGAEHTIIEDHIEAASFMSMAAATGGEIRLTGIHSRNYWMTRRIFERLGIEFELKPDSIFLPGCQKMKIKSDLGNAIPVVSDGPWPQFPSDMMSCSIVMATQAQGTVLFFEKMFESRIYFVDRLISMGASVVVCDPHRVVINGPTRLRGITMSSPDIRAGMAMVIAAICANGTSTIQNSEMIARGYEQLEERITALGGKITFRA
jgi:UDP-N-acetylglucosamine 1-carboxyvinyltransferase